MPDLITFPDILAARDRLAGVAVRTPLLRFHPERLRAAGFALPSNAPEIYLKNEAAQPIGSFKLRGAYNHIAALAERDPEALRRGVITFSSGNHAQGVAYAARALGVKAVIVMPENAPEVKRRATQALGAEIVTVGPASTERKRKAEDLVAAHGYAMVPPYDDPLIIAGQATCGLEIADQLAALPSPFVPQHPSPLDTSHLAPQQNPSGAAPLPTLVLAPVSGGGLLSGVATGLTLASEAAGRTPPLIWGCEPELAADAYASFHAKTLMEWPAAHTSRTLADGLRSQSLGQRNFDHILEYVSGIVTVTEAEIRTATRFILLATDIVAEPSGAVTLAAALFHPHELPHTARIVAVVSGGNIEPTLQAELLSDDALS